MFNRFWRKNNEEEDASEDAVEDFEMKDENKSEVHQEVHEGGSSLRSERKGSFIHNTDYYDDKTGIGVVETIVSTPAEVSDDQLIALLRKAGFERPQDVSDVSPDLQYVGQQIVDMSFEDAVDILKEGAEYHRDDPNLTSEEYEGIVQLSQLDPSTLHPFEQDALDLKAVAGLLHFHSPYKPVRACVNPDDDYDAPVETFRSYFLSFIWAIIGSAFNEFFAHRQVVITISTSMIQLLLFPMGNLWAKIMPCCSFPIWKGKRVHLNLPEPWSHKEQMFATCLFSIAVSTFYMNTVILTLKINYKEHVSFGYQFFTSIAVQFLGFGFAGVLRRFVIYPSRAIWPSQLQTMALNKALFSKKVEKNSRGLTSQTFFYICVAFIFFYEWLPTYLFQALGTFNWMTWIKPDNFNLAMVTGSMGGVGINPIASFDWNVINYYNSVITPFFSYANQMAGGLIAAICVLAIYYSNQYDSQYLPMFSNALFTNKGDQYEVTAILNQKAQVEDKKYQNYSPPYYSAGNFFCYGAFIASYPLLFAYSFLTEWKVMLGAFKEWGSAIWSLTKKDTWLYSWKAESKVLEMYNDAHSRMMRRYKEVPDWWYYLVLIASIVVGIAALEGYHTSTPIWSLFMAVGLNAVFLIPITILEATTAVQLGLNVLIEIIMGYALPGNPIALMLIKAFGYNIDGQADSYVGNLKLGHYSKIPPMALFRGQMMMVLVQTFVTLGVLNWSIYNISDYCSPNQSAHFTCPDAVTYYNSSVLWGAIGPKRIFESIYPILKWCWLIGAVIGVVLGVWKLVLPKFYPVWFNPLLVIGGMLNMAPPYNLTYITPGAIANFFSQFYMRKYHLRLWQKYNYVLTAGFQTGLVISSIIIFFAVQYKEKPIYWWGNDVINNGIDALSPPKRNISLTSRGYFGPQHGHFP